MTTPPALSELPSDTPIRVLFVCMGNICRSPLMESVFRHLVAERGVEDRFDIDSAGTGAWHAGESPDRRMRATGKAHGVTVDGRARQVTKRDFSDYDLIICADESNRDDLLQRGSPEDRTHLMLEFDDESPLHEVPDPYYGADDGFELVYKLVDAACRKLLDRLLAETAT
jgi:protein-tyrosine phosphatase